MVVARTAGPVIDGWTRLRPIAGADDEPGDGAGDGEQDPRSAARSRCLATVVVAFVLVAGNPFVVKIFVNGLESGVTVLLFALVLALGAPGPGARDGGHTTLIGAAPAWITGRSHRWRLGTGALLAVLFLGRTDTVIVIGCLGLWILATTWPLGRDDMIGIVEVFAPVGVTAVVYLVWNQAVFGTAVQISGLIKRVELTGATVGRFAVFVAVAVVIGVVAFRRRDRRALDRQRFPRATSFVRATAWYGSACVLLLGYYTVLQSQQWLWYYCPIAIYVIWLVVLGVADFVESAILEAPATKSTTAALLPIQLLLLVPLLIGLVWQTRSFLDPDLRSIQIANKEAGQWIDANLPEDAVLASWDAGVVGYFSHRSVINLDGVVNSKEWYDAGRNGTTAEFLADRDLGWIVNHGTPVDGQDPDIIAYIKSLYGPDVAAQSELEHSWPFRFSGVTMGSGGTKGGGTRDQAVFLYRLPPLPQP